MRRMTTENKQEVKTLLPLEARVYDARDTLVAAAMKLGNSVTQEVFFRAFRDAQPYHYYLFMYVKEEFEKKKLMRICGNPAIVHPLGGIFNVNDYMTLNVGGKIVTHPRRELIMDIAAVHDLEEDCGVTPKILEGKLKEIERVSGCEIPYKKRTIESMNLLNKNGVQRQIAKNGADLFMREFKERIAVNQSYHNRIIKQALYLKAHGDPTYDADVLAKQADQLDNQDSITHIGEGAELPVKTLLKTKMCVEGSMRLLQEGYNPFVCALQNALVGGALQIIPEVRERVEADLHYAQTHISNGLKRYGLPRYDVLTKKAEFFTQTLDGLESFFKEAGC